MSGNKNKPSDLLEESINPGEDDIDDETLIPLDQFISEYSEAKEAGKDQKDTDTDTNEEQDKNSDSLTHAQALEEQKKIAAQNLDKALRVQAEMENLRKRTTRDIENAHKYALEKFLGELLPVIDSLELGLSAASESSADVSSLKEGMELTHKMFVSLLEKQGIMVVDPVGEKFNPEQHEAVTMLEQEGVASGHVISVMQKGYTLNGRLVRPAMVVVAK